MRSRFRHSIRWRLPRHRRSYRVWGAEGDRGRYLKCWNCGFLIDTHRGLSTSDTSGNSYSQPAGNDIVSVDVTSGSSPILPDTVYWDTPFEIGLILRDGYVIYSIDTSVGACPLCGTSNLP